MPGDPAKLAAVVFDWAGTVVDFGSHAPMGAFVELFASQGVAIIDIAEARVPMGPLRASPNVAVQVTVAAA